MQAKVAAGNDGRVTNALLDGSVSLLEGEYAGRTGCIDGIAGPWGKRQTLLRNYAKILSWKSTLMKDMCTIDIEPE